MNTVKHLICDKEIVTLTSFKRSNNLNQLEVYKILCNSKSTDDKFTIGEFDYKVVRRNTNKPKETMIIPSDSLEDCETVKDVEMFLIKTIPKIKYSEKKKTRYLPFIYTDPRKSITRKTGEIFLIVNNVKITMKQIQKHLEITKHSVKSRFYGIDSLYINGVYVKVARVRLPTYFEILWYKNDKIQPIRGFGQLKTRLKIQLSSKEKEQLELINQGKVLLEFKNCEVRVKG